MREARCGAPGASGLKRLGQGGSAQEAGAEEGKELLVGNSGRYGHDPSDER